MSGPKPMSALENDMTTDPDTTLADITAGRSARDRLGDHRPRPLVDATEPLHSIKPFYDPVGYDPEGAVSHWNYRLIRNGDAVGVHEVFYAAGTPVLWTEEPARLVADDAADMVAELNMLRSATERPVLIEERYTTADGERRVRLIEESSAEI
jgi:hypothetical protein